MLEAVFRMLSPAPRKLVLIELKKPRRRPLDSGFGTGSGGAWIGSLFPLKMLIDIQELAGGLDWDDISV